MLTCCVTIIYEFILSSEVNTQLCLRRVFPVPKTSETTFRGCPSVGLATLQEGPCIWGSHANSDPLTQAAVTIRHGAEKIALR